MTSRALAWRTVTAKPGRAVLAVTGVTVIGALLFNMLLLSNGLLLSFRELLDTAGYDVRVVATDGAPSLRVPMPQPVSLAAQLERLPEVAEVGFFRTNSAVVTVAGRPPARTDLIETSPRADRRMWRVVAGQSLSEATGGRDRPLVVNRALADLLGLAPGATVGVRLTLQDVPSALPTSTFRVAGVAEFGFEPDGELVAATSMDAFRETNVGMLSAHADVVLVRSNASFGPAAATAAINKRHPDLRAYSNEQVVERFDQNGFAYFRQISLVLTTITLGFAFLLVATLLSVSVNQRLHEVAALRALGLPRRRIAATLLWESAWLVGAGALLSLPLGGVLALAFDRILRAMPGLPGQLHFFVFEASAVGLHLALLAVTAVGAAVYPVWIATRLPIAATLRQETL